MSQLLHLADASDLPRLLPMVETFHREAGIDSSADGREAGVMPLLDGNPLGAIWMIGPKMAPVGYVCVSFGWSIELGGMDGMIDELWIREKVRGRGMGTEALDALKKALGAAGITALHLEGVGEGATRLYERSGFRRRPHALMTWYA